jgi:Fe2+ or Zn2+ uptake regulation protein
MKESKLNCEKIWKIQKKGKLNSEKIWKIWKKSKLNSEKRGKLWKKSKLNSEKIWKIQKKRAYLHHHHHRRCRSGSNSDEIPPNHVTNKNKTKHTMQISHINVYIYDKTPTSQRNSD